MMEKRKQIQIKNNLLNQEIKNKDLSLSIQLSLDGFSFCTINQIQKKISNFNEFEFKFPSATPQAHLQNVMEVVDKIDFLNQEFNNVSISHVNNLSTLVPKALFNDQNLSDYLKFSHKIYSNDYITFDEILNHNITNVYVPFVNINNFFIDKFGGFDYTHFSTVLIKNLLDTYKFSERPHLFCHVQKSHFEIIAIANNSLELYNSYNYNSKEDFLYFVLFTAEQLNYSPEVLELVFIGDVVKNDDLYNIAYKYIRNVSFIENRNKFKIDSTIDEIKQRKFYSLLHQL